MCTILTLSCCLIPTLSPLFPTLHGSFEAANNADIHWHKAAALLLNCCDTSQCTQWVTHNYWPLAPEEYSQVQHQNIRARLECMSDPYKLQQPMWLCPLKSQHFPVTRVGRHLQWHDMNQLSKKMSLLPHLDIKCTCINHK